MRFLQQIVLAGALLAVPAHAAAQEPGVIVSIKPLHALVTAIMGKAPALLLDGAASPHHATLRPSQAGALQDADIVFWIGPEMETFLEGPIATIANRARSVALIEDEELRKLPYRSASMNGHQHAHEHEHEHDHGHEHGSLDGHVWLDPVNASAMARRIAAVLAEADPENAERYRQNAEKLQERLAEVDRELAAKLSSVRGIPFIVFHDAYQYFERRYGLGPTTAIAVNPDVMPGADRIRALRQRIADADVGCIFAEPQFDPKLVSVVAEGSAAATATLDPLGATIEAGPDQYFELIRTMAASMHDCLAGQAE